MDGLMKLIIKNSPSVCSGVAYFTWNRIFTWKAAWAISSPPNSWKSTGLSIRVVSLTTPSVQDYNRFNTRSTVATYQSNMFLRSSVACILLFFIFVRVDGPMFSFTRAHETKQCCSDRIYKKRNPKHSHPFWT